MVAERIIEITPNGEQDYMSLVKPAYSEHYEKPRAVAYQAAHQVLDNVILNKRGQPIAKRDIELRGIDMGCIATLKRYVIPPKNTRSQK